VRRALLATAVTVVGLVALLDYKSDGGIGRSGVPVNRLAGPGSAAAPATTPPARTSHGSSSAAAKPSSSGEFNGTDVQYTYGDIEVRITVAGGRITAVTVPQESAPDPRSQFINSQAIPILTREVLAAQGIHIDAVSGATFTSDAFAQSLQSALDKAGR
jgi:uncharacterized protein with FMN-binding domain